MIVSRLRWLLTLPLRFIHPAPIACETTVLPVNYDGLCVALLYVVGVLLALRMPPMGDAEGLVFWNGLLLLFFPVAVRASWPGVARVERWLLVLLLAEAAFAVKLLYAPGQFVHFDEFLHWLTVADMLQAHRLFLPNSLLPVSPLYPGLELATAALVSLSGCSLFAAAIVVLVTARALFISSLFALYDLLTGSARVAALASLTYMGVSTYLLFDSQFAYESLALPLATVVLFAEAQLARLDAAPPVTVLICAPLLVALAATHHLTSYFTAFVLGLTGVAQLVVAPRRVFVVIPVAVFAMVSVLLWSHFIGNPASNYLGPVLNEGVAQFKTMLGGHKGGERQLFVSDDGTRTPLYMQLESFAQVGLTALLLAFGFFSSLVRANTEQPSGWRGLFGLFRGRWRNPRLLVCVLLALAWPLSIVLRLTPASWEIGNRLGTFAYIGVGLVVAIAMLRVWRTPRQWWWGGLCGACLSLFFVGGVISGWGTSAVRTGYKVEGDSLSVEPMSIDAARWARQWLGPRNRFAADRDNRLLLATYGEQTIVTGLYDGYDTADLYVVDIISQKQLDEIRRAQIDYVLVDMRLTTGKPKLGNFFEPGEETAIHETPLDADGLLKFDHTPSVSRVFDDGWIRIYDVRALQHAGIP